jgi:hypothetical protein
MSENTVNIFEQASREKLRIPSPRGDLAVEQLWDLPLTSKSGVSLDSLAVALNSELQNSTPMSFVDRAGSPRATQLQLQFTVVKHILDVRMAEAEVRRTAAVRTAEASKLREILADRKDSDLRALPAEELEKRLAALEAQAG